MGVRRAIAVGVALGLLVACGSSNEPTARAKFEAALEKTLRAEAATDQDRAVAECIISTTKNLSDADYAKIVQKENPTPDVLETYRASLASCGELSTSSVTTGA